MEHGNVIWKWMVYLIVNLSIFAITIYTLQVNGFVNYFERITEVSNFWEHVIPILTLVLLVNIVAIFLNPEIHSLLPYWLLKRYKKSFRWFFKNTPGQVIASFLFATLTGVIVGFFGGIIFYFLYVEPGSSLIQILKIAFVEASILSSVLVVIGRTLASFLTPFLACLIAMIIAYYISGLVVAVIIGLMAAVVAYSLL